MEQNNLGQNEQPMTQEAPKLELVVINKAKNIEMRYALEQGKELTVGAEPECSILVEDEYISGKHFSIKLTGDSIVAQDLGSKNGLYLQLTETKKIDTGQTLLAGKTIFRIEKKDEQPLPANRDDDQPQV